MENKYRVEPPKPADSIDAWKRWMKEEAKAETQAKRADTKECLAGDMPDIFQDTIMRKVNGVWKQTRNVGMTGNEEDYSLEPTIPATQERSIDEARQIIRARGVSHSKPGNWKRKQRRLRRQLKRDGLV